MNLNRSSGTWRYVALVVLGLNAALLGVWALFAPASFYRSFPGGGRSWVSVDGPYNEHLVRDVGGLNLALLVVTIAALLLRQRVVTRIAALAWLPFAAPHVVYHIAHADDLASSADKVASIGGLLLVVLFALALAISPSSRANGHVEAIDGSLQ